MQEAGLTLGRRLGCRWQGRIMRVHRFQNPLEHWLRGFMVEVLAFAFFFGAILALSALITMVL